MPTSSAQVAAAAAAAAAAVASFPGQFLDLSSLLSSGCILASGSVLNSMNIAQLPQLAAKNSETAVVAASAAASSSATKFTTFFAVLQFLCGVLSILVGILGVVVASIRIRKQVIIATLLLSSGQAILSAICLTFGALEAKETWSDAKKSIDNFAKMLMNCINTVCSICLCVSLTKRVHRYRDYAVCRFHQFRPPVMVCTGLVITTSIASLSAFASGVLLSVTLKTNYAGGLHMGLMGLTLGLTMVLNLKLMLHQASTIACLLLTVFTLLSSCAAAYTESIELDKVVGTQSTRRLYHGYIIKSAVVYFSALLNIATVGALGPCQFLRLWHMAVIQSSAEEEDAAAAAGLTASATAADTEMDAGGAATTAGDEDGVAYQQLLASTAGSPFLSQRSRGNFGNHHADNTNASNSCTLLPRMPYYNHLHHQTIVGTPQL